MSNDIIPTFSTSSHTDNFQKLNNDLISLIKKQDIQSRFIQVLGKQSKSFFSSLITLVNQEPNLQKCDPMSILTAAMDAANLGLPINKSLGFVHLMPVNNKATFVLDYRGLIQLALRSGKIRKLKAECVCKGEIVKYNKFTDEIIFGSKESNEIVGYFAHILLDNGFEHILYRTKEEMIEYRNNKINKISVNSTAWNNHFDVMAKKTLIKQLLSRYAPITIDYNDNIVIDNDDICCDYKE